MFDLPPIIKNFIESFSISKKDNPKINKLPPDLVEQIFKHLETKDIKSASLVNRNWHDIAVKTVAHEKQDYKNSLNTLAASIAEKLPEKKESLLKIVEENKENPKNFDLFDSLFNILKELNKDELITIDDLMTPAFKETIAIYQHIDLILKEKNLDVKSIELNILMPKLFNLNEEKATQIALIIPDTFHKAEALEFVSNELANRGKENKAKEVADLIPAEASDLKTRSLEYIVKMQNIKEVSTIYQKQVGVKS